MDNIGWLFRRHLSYNIFKRMSSKFTYEDAIQKLNSMQSNKVTLDLIMNSGPHSNRKESISLVSMEKYLLRTGLKLSKLDELSVIHVAGTKGKGGTSAMCESILRHHGYKTGFYTSPHLVAVNERIRLNGKPINRENFASYTQRLSKMMEDAKKYEGDMPSYFQFLTVMAFNVFLDEKVDVAVIEVGIGGTYDYTNILRKVSVVGITALGMDHTGILGDTIDQIAAAKAGIMKPTCVAYTVDQPPEAMEVLRRVASRVKCPLYVAPKYETLFPNKQDGKLSVNLDAYYTNASLAVQLAHAWMRTRSAINENTLDTPILNGEARQNDLALSSSTVANNDGYNGNERDKSLIDQMSEISLQGLRNLKWPGRYQVIKTDYAEFYLDGAHTKESMEICASWFESSAADRSINKILIFSSTGDRNNDVLLTQLKNINFQRVYFVIPTAYKGITKKNDNYSIVNEIELMARCESNVSIWKNLNESPSTVMESVSDAVKNINECCTYSYVLITGSLHLVGASLSILDPDLS